MAIQSKFKVHYFFLTILILISHIAMLGVVFFKGNYDTLKYPVILSAFIVLSDIVYSGIIKARKQSVYIIDYMMLFILNMTVIFQSCFGEIGFSYKMSRDWL